MGRGLGVGADLGVGVGLAVDVAVAVAVAVGVPVGVAVAVAVAVGVALGVARRRWSRSSAALQDVALSTSCGTTRAVAEVLVKRAVVLLHSSCSC